MLITLITIITCKWISFQKSNIFIEIYECHHSNINSPHHRGQATPTFVQTSTHKRSRIVPFLTGQYYQPWCQRSNRNLYSRNRSTFHLPVQERDVLLRARRRHNATARCTRPSRWIYRAAWK